MKALQGKVAIVTGASSGIGRASASLFAKEGAAVVLGARRSHELGELVDEIVAEGGRARFLDGDVSDEAFARELVALAEREFSALHVAFNNAGTLGAMGPTPDIELTHWRDTIEVNLTAAFLAARYQIPAMLKHRGGSVIFTGTFVGHTIGIPGASAYAASKSGLVGLTQALATEFGPQGIRVNVLMPGGTDTPMAWEMNPTQEAMAHVASLHALKRIASPAELARAALFLTSDQAAFMTGAAMLVDGGISINRT